MFKVGRLYTGTDGEIYKLVGISKNNRDDYPLVTRNRYDLTRTFTIDGRMFTDKFLSGSLTSKQCYLMPLKLITTKYNKLKESYETKRI
jgi:hypothetical protein